MPACPTAPTSRKTNPPDQEIDPDSPERNPWGVPSFEVMNSPEYKRKLAAECRAKAAKHRPAAGEVSDDPVWAADQDALRQKVAEREFLKTLGPPEIARGALMTLLADDIGAIAAAVAREVCR
jgi:hypothetical protein